MSDERGRPKVEPPKAPRGGAIRHPDPKAKVVGDCMEGPGYIDAEETYESYD